MAGFHDKVVYQIYPKSFRDSNGDGFGDLQGVIEKLDYLADLGVDYLWLTPFFVSPQKDNGYDVADYRHIDPRFGTMEDVEQLIAKAKERGMGLMFDMVFNHTSTEHDWFRRALDGEKKYQDYYIFRDGAPDTPPTNWISKFGGPAWEYVPKLGKWYLHLFDKTQADLNWENPAVRQELQDILRFWKEKGIQGFRFDVVNLISKPEAFENDMDGDGRRFYTDGRHVHEFLQEMVAESGIEGMVTVGEMSSTSLANCVRYSRPADKELSMVFNFHHLKVDYRDGDKWKLMPPDIAALKKLFAEWQEGMQAGNGWNATFWCNHDQPRAVSRFGDDGTLRKISAKMLGACIHLMRGTPYIYQGEEIGMTNAKYKSIDEYRDVESLNYYEILCREGKSSDEALAILAARSRDNGRTPMQWSAETYAGFSSAEPWIMPPDNYRQINAEAEKEDADSIFAFYQQLIRLRHELPIIAEGTISFLEHDTENVIAYQRDLGSTKLVVLCNFSNQPVIPKERALQEYTAEGFTKLLGNYVGMETALRPFEVIALLKQ